MRIRTAMPTLLSLIALLFGCERAGPYQLKDGAWRFGKEALDVPAGEQVTALNARFGKSASRVWYRATPIPEADSASFTVLDEHYARDRAHAWFAKTYRDSQDYFTTERVLVRRLEGADPARLKLLGQDYASDGSRVYDEGQGFGVADAASFEPLDGGFARDRAAAYFRNRPIEGAKGEGFPVLGQHFAADAGAVFFAEDGPPPAVRRLKGADPAGFTPLSYGYARDARRAWFQDRPLGARPEELQVLDFGYAKTATVVFYYGRPIKGADAASFAILDPVTDEASARDKTGLYKDGQRVR